MSTSSDANDAVALGLDVGTSGVKAVAVDGRGRVVAEAVREHPLLTPRPGWTEQRPSDWLDGTLGALRELAGALGGRRPLALGLSGQMHGMVPLDAHGEVVRPAILWNDQRTGEAVAELEAAVPRWELIGRGGNPAITGFQLPKLLWLRRAEPDAFRRTRHVLFPKDFIGYRLCGRMVAEPSDASGSNCFHLADKRWDEEVLAAVGVAPTLFPEVVPSDARVGGLTADVARATGLPVDLPLVAGAGDNAAAATGLGISSRRPQLGSVSLGTSGVLLAPLERPTPDPEGRAHLFCHADGGWFLLGVTLAAAGALRWLRDTLFPGEDFAALAALAERSPAGANGVVFRPHLAGERTPYLDPALRGQWRGLSLASDRADLVRSVLEGVAFSLREALDVMRPLTRLERLLATGGGTRSELWLALLASALELPLTRPERAEGAAHGAALLALRGVGAETPQPPLDGPTTRPELDLEAALARYRATPP